MPLTDEVRIAEIRAAAVREEDQRHRSQLATLVEWSSAITSAGTLAHVAETTVAAITAIFQATARLVLVHDRKRTRAGPEAPLVHTEDGFHQVVATTIYGIGGSIEIERAERPLDPSERLVAAHLQLVTFSSAERLVVLAEARERARERQDIVAIVAHDLRTPLQTFAMGLDTIRATVDPTTGLKIEASARRMMRSVAAMTRLLEDLLDVSRVHDGALPVRLASHLVAPLVEDLRSQHEETARKKHLALTAHVDPLLTMSCDAQRVIQALGNVLTNALRHTERGSITLTARAAPGDRVRFEVIDTGPGVPAALRERLFERLFQGETSGRAGGIGLGLYIVHGIVAAHHGTLGLDSEVGRGTTFWMELPRGGAPERAPG